MGGPFDLNDLESYRRWREQKLSAAPLSAEELVVDVRDPRKLLPHEHDALSERIRRCNMAIYAGNFTGGDTELLRLVGAQFGLVQLDANWLAGEDGISSIQVFEGGTRKHYIPYTDKPIKWHTDGYYNPLDRQIRGMVLHCVRAAASGGENRLMDHEMAYLLLREENPEHIYALMQPDAMTIPERVDEAAGVRPAQSGPVFSLDAKGHLHMRYTARTRSIVWKQDAATLAAVAALEQLLASDSPYIYQARLEPGMGLLCNNVLHDRAAFADETSCPRLLYRARFLDRIHSV
ncbi:MAG: TauD/TfdA family dioxygenase [Gammaproteobacteria bacterium]|nr:TauD/TfdA family dioxygenase [Gammaproteobacteria bacterium]MBU1777572.1 TauD/TfdA family dioxygenase [Gammaproteobacteria bacterium]MBU1969940.1 TauD/TfdA family dioxygenase [Gammaproteobacteria bacterium]